MGLGQGDREEDKAGCRGKQDSRAGTALGPTIGLPRLKAMAAMLVGMAHDAVVLVHQDAFIFEHQLILSQRACRAA